MWMIWYLLGILHPWFKMYSDSWWSSSTWHILAFCIISLASRFINLQMGSSSTNKNMLLICFRDLEWLIVSQHPHHFSQASHLLQVAHHPVLIRTCIDNWLGVSYTWHIPDRTSLLQLDLSLDSPRILMRVIRMLTCGMECEHL